ncbi:MAG: LLM class flavin-dependent oxidoreductase [Geminicoccaceae bacterium]
MPTLHPIVAAKMGTTIEPSPKGRFGINMVCGWFTPEMEMFGVKMMGDTRYEYATSGSRSSRSCGPSSGSTTRASS